MKTSNGKQSQNQKDFQKMFESAGYYYGVIRSFEEFCSLVNFYISNSNADLRRDIASTHVEITKAAEQREKKKFYKIIGKK